MSLEIYLLSILDTLSASIAVFGCVFLAIGFIALMIKLDPDDGIAKKPFVMISISLILGAIILLSASLVPTRKSLIESYLMTEGKDLATSENIETIFNKLDEKSDKLIDNLTD